MLYNCNIQADLRRQRCRENGGAERTEEEEAVANQLPPHKSFEHHHVGGGNDGTGDGVKAQQRLSIDVTLAPSCRSCRVSINVVDDEVEEGEERATKRRKLEASEEADGGSKDATAAKDATANDGKTTAEATNDPGNNKGGGEHMAVQKKKKHVQFAAPEAPLTTGPASAPEPASSKMERSEILKRIQKALPRDVQVDYRGFGDDGASGTSQKKVETTNGKTGCKAEGAGEDKEDEVERDYLSKPLGTVLKEYDRSIRDSSASTKKAATASTQEATASESTDETGHFVVSIANGTDPNVASYHAQVQKLATFYIETAEDVHVSDDRDGGYWTVLYLFRRHEAQEEKETDAGAIGSSDGTPTRHYKYSLAGYVTLFHFHAPFKKPTPGVVVRICQALVLPPYQRAGHGKVLLETVHDLARGGGSYDYKDEQYAGLEPLFGNVVEVNVEDPAPSFVALRDRIDYELLKHDVAGTILSRVFVTGAKEGQGTSEFDGGSEAINFEGDSFFAPLPESEAVEAACRAKIVPHQVHVARDLLKLEVVEREVDRLRQSVAANIGAELDAEAASSKSNERIELLEKRYRLMVKKGLLKVYQEELGACPGGKDGQRKRLAELFDNTLRHYRRVLCQTSRQ